VPAALAPALPLRITLPLGDTEGQAEEVGVGAARVALPCRLRVALSEPVLPPEGVGSAVVEGVPPVGLAEAPLALRVGAALPVPPPTVPVPLRLPPPPPPPLVAVAHALVAPVRVPCAAVAVRGAEGEAVRVRGALGVGVRVEASPREAVERGLAEGSTEAEDVEEGAALAVAGTVPKVVRVAHCEEDCEMEALAEGVPPPPPPAPPPPPPVERVGVEEREPGRAVGETVAVGGAEALAEAEGEAVGGAVAVL
jgi:hypothetical protein